MRNYTSKTVYIGIDVHKKTYAVTAICNKEVIKKDTMIANPDKLLKYITKYFEGAKVYTAYEAGFSGFHLHRFLIKKGIKNIVVHPASIEVSSRDRVKTDKRDSLKIAKHLSNAMLRGIKIPSKKRENFRSITRMRNQLVENRKRTGNHLKSLLFLHGIIEADDNRQITKKWIKWLMCLSLDEDVKFCIETHVDEWLRLSEKILEINKKLSEQAKKDKDVDVMYRAVPGIGALSARILANELETMRHFTNEKQLFSYTGLTPSERSSGENKRQGNISRQGRSILRKILVQVAWRAIKQDESLLEFFDRVSMRGGKKRAIVGVARKMIGRIRATFISGELYVVKQATV